MVSPPLDEIREMARKVVESEHLELVDVEFKVGKARSLLRIFIDKTGGVTLDDCENVSRQLSALLDVQDLVKLAYVLEVSSPGLDRPFKTDRDYERSLGQYVRVHYTDSEDKPRQAAGILSNLTETELTLEEHGQMLRLSRERIHRAHQDVQMAPHPGKKRKGHR